MTYQIEIQVRTAVGPLWRPMSTASGNPYTWPTRDAAERHIAKWYPARVMRSADVVRVSEVRQSGTKESRL